MIIMIQFCAYIVLCSCGDFVFLAGGWIPPFGEEAVVTHTTLPHLCEQSILVCVKVVLYEFLRIVSYGPSGVVTQLCPKDTCAEAPECLGLA